MKKLNPKAFFKNTLKTIDKNSPTILAVIGVAGIVTTAVLAVKATPKAVKIVEAEKERRKVDDICVADKVKLTWKCYIPTAVSAVMSSVCVIGSTMSSVKKQSALAAACAFTERTLCEYQDKVKETLGEKKAEEIRDDICKEHIERNPVSATRIIDTGRGKTLCYDMFSGRYFYSDINFLKKSVNDDNLDMLRDPLYCAKSATEVQCNWGLEPTTAGNILGFNAYDGGLIELEFSTQLTEDEVPCLVVSFKNMPRVNYDDIPV